MEAIKEYNETMSKRCVRKVLRSNKVRKPRLVVREAKKANLYLPDALAMLQQETGIPQKNIFGCDWGPGILFCHLKVTRKRIRKLIKDGRAQGVGWTQITFQAFVHAAQSMGGAWRPKYQMREGFRILASNIKSFGVQEGHARYNGSGPDAEAYGRASMSIRQTWKSRLNHCHNKKGG